MFFRKPSDKTLVFRSFILNDWFEQLGQCGEAGKLTGAVTEEH